MKEVGMIFEQSRWHRRDNLILKCLFYFGLRNSELVTISSHDIDLDNRTLKVISGKKKERCVPVPTNEFLHDLRNYIGDRTDGDLFTISDRQIRRIVKSYARKAGIKKPGEVHPHTLRHSYATHLQNAGVPLNMIQEILGHERIETTTVYVHLGLERMREHIEKAFRTRYTL